MFKIDTNIPAPPVINRAAKYPFKNMKVGDSFLIPSGMHFYTVAAAAKAFADKQHPKWVFSTRKTSEGHRCWRVA